MDWFDSCGDFIFTCPFYNFLHLSLFITLIMIKVKKEVYYLKYEAIIFLLFIYKIFQVAFNENIFCKY